MTREEALRELMDIRDEATAYPDAVCYVTSEDEDALNVAIEALKVKTDGDLISRQDAIDAIMGEPTDAHYPSWYADRIKALPSAEAEKPNMKSWDGLYIKVYADDDPQDKAEKLYQICDSNEALSEVAKCIQWYLDYPSANYERATNQMEHDIAYEPTYNPEDGSM